MSMTQPTPSNAGLILLRLFPGRIAALLQKDVEERQRISGHQRLSTRATADDALAAQQHQDVELATLITSTQAAIVGLRGESEKLQRAAASDAHRRMDERLALSDMEAERARQDRERDAWARWRPVLDLHTPVEMDRAVRDLASAALARGDDDTLAALRKELPAHIQARAGKEVAVELEPIVMRALDETMAAARPDVSLALQELRELETGMPRLLTAFGQAEYMVKSGELSTVIPSWNPRDNDLIVQAAPVTHS